MYDKDIRYRDTACVTTRVLVLKAKIGAATSHNYDEGI